MIADILARLMEPETPFKMSGAAGSLSDIKDAPRAVPAVFGYISAEKSEPNERATGRIMQRTRIDVSIVIVTRNLSKSDNGLAATDIDPLKAKVRSRMIGWQPTDDHDPIEHVEGELIQAVGGYVWFEDVYTTATYTEEA